MSPAIRRFVESEGTSATLREFSPTGSDEYNDPTGPGESTTSTTALVKSLTNPRQISTPSGEEVTVETRIVVPDDLAITPDADEIRPQIEVGAKTYKIWAVDDEGPLSGVQQLLVEKVR